MPKFKIEKMYSWCDYWEDVIDELKDCYWIISKYRNFNSDLEIEHLHIEKAYNGWLVVGCSEIKKITKYIRWDGVICFRGKKSAYRSILYAVASDSENPAYIQRKLNPIYTQFENAEIQFYMYQEDDCLQKAICYTTICSEIIKKSFKKFSFIKKETINEVSFEKMGLKEITWGNIEISSFCQYFYDRIDQMRDCFWIVDISNFNSIKEELIQNEKIEHYQNKSILTTDTLKKVSWDIIDKNIDWNCQKQIIVNKPTVLVCYEGEKEVYKEILSRLNETKVLANLETMSKEEINIINRDLTKGKIKALIYSKMEEDNENYWNSIYI